MFEHAMRFTAFEACAALIQPGVLEGVTLVAAEA
jgi:hypothetical protein